MISSTIILLFFTLLFHPQETLVGAKKGVILWVYTVIPTLFPFVVISNLMMQTNAISHIVILFGSVFKKLFAVSDNGVFAVIAGFLCGYPMGAKVTADLVKTNRISKKEGQYLLSFCNNASPMFVVSYIVFQSFGDIELTIPTLLILFGSPLLCSFFFRLYHKPKLCIQNHSENNISFSFSMLDSSVMDGFITVTKIGGYIMLFSVLIQIFSAYNFRNTWLSTFEITSGIQTLMHTYNSYFQAYVPVLALSSFGGLCAIIQTKSMLQNTSLSLLPYIIEKLITTMVTSLFAYLYIKLYK